MTEKAAAELQRGGRDNCTELLCCWRAQDRGRNFQCKVMLINNILSLWRLVPG